MRLRLWMTRGCRVLLRGGDPAALVNALCEAGISVTELHCSGSDSFRLETDESDIPMLLETAEKMGCAAEITKRRGAGRAFRRFRLRPELLVLPFLLLLLTISLSTRIWEIDISGNRTLTNGELLAALEEAGVYPGVSGLHIDNLKVRTTLQQILPSLSWATVQVHGSRALVVVRERIPAPQIVDETAYGDLIAAKSGVIELPGIREGKREVSKGELVLAGQLLASGTLRDKQGDLRQVHAMGEVWAQTWYEKTMEMPLDVLEPVAGEKIKHRYALKICDFRMNFYRDSGISPGSYVKMENEVRPAVGGLSLPFSLIRIELRERGGVQRMLPQETAEMLLRERLSLWLDGETDGAERISEEYDAEEKDGVISVTLRAVCREQIAAERPCETAGDNPAP